MTNIIHVVEGRQSDDPEVYDGKGVPGATEWQFSDGPPGERGSSADFQSLEEGLRAFPDATFQFHFEDPFTIVEGINEWNQLTPDGRQPPFSVFIPSMQEYLPISFDTRNGADTMARILCEIRGTKP